VVLVVSQVQPQVLQKLSFFIFIVLLVISLIANAVGDNHQKFREKLMTFIKKISTSLIIFVAMFGLTACSDKEAEEAGKKVEETVKDAGKMTQGAGDKVNEMKEDASKVIDAAGKKMNKMKQDAEKAMENVGEKVEEMKKDAGEAVENAGIKVNAMKESVSNKFGEMKKDTGNAIENTCEKTKEGVDAKGDGC
jgi:membrane-associated HD superfamily phosphohydrolase